MNTLVNIIIIIVNFESEDAVHLSDKLIRSGLEVIVVDNSQKQKYVYTKGVSVIRNVKNKGFSEACNQGVFFAMKRNPKWIMLLNPDVTIHKKQIEILLKNEGDLISPILKYNDGNRTNCDFGGRVNLITGHTQHITSNMPHIPLTKIDYISGACMLIKTKVFRKIGNFDNKFYLYFEDVDFCMRAKGKGFRISVDRNIIIDHWLSKIVGRRSFRKHYLLMKSYLIFINKHIQFKFKPIAIINWCGLCLRILVSLSLNMVIRGG